MEEKAIKSVLVVEDNPGIQKQLKWAFSDYRVFLADDRASALETVKTHRPSVITLDLGLPPDPTNATEGLAALDEILDITPHAKIIVVTGNDDLSNALKSVSLGAYDFYQKPIDPDVLTLIVERAYRLFELEEALREQARAQSSSPLDGIVGTSKAMAGIARIIEKVAPSEATTLILGESGTGKELFARALHNLSARHASTFTAVNCAAIPENLLESELFGYEKGAFTGAVKQTPGKIECAEGGTLFLDEIGDMPMNLQAKMLRFLQERVIERLGGRVAIPVDVRIVCATHQNLAGLIRENRFREDLYYRISEIVVEVPPLREREGDRVLLAQYYLQKFAAQYSRVFKGFTEEAVASLDSYSWPGNVRELENKVKRAVVLSEGQRLTSEDLGFEAHDEMESLDLRKGREAVERRLIRKALDIHGDNMSHAADALGVSRPSLYSLMKKLGMKEFSNS